MAVLFDRGVEASALFSECRTWRYTLTRTWDRKNPLIAFVGLNPSTADETKLDNTTTKCVKWARRDGFGSYVMLNLFGLVSTLPGALKAAADPVGPDNDLWIKQTFSDASAVVFCWGTTLHNLTGPRIEVVKQLADEAGLNPLCPGHTKAGFPKHPCRLANATKLVLYKR